MADLDNMEKRLVHKIESVTASGWKAATIVISALAVTIAGVSTALSHIEIH